MKRLRFLEAAIVQIARPGQRLREWFTASSLAAMRLPNLPTTRHGIVIRADREEWPRRFVTGRGGERFEFHFSALPRPAFDEIIRRVYALPEGSSDVAEVLPPSLPEPPRQRDPTPQWLLPLLRVIKDGGPISPSAVMRRLPKHLPKGAPIPTLDEVSAALRSYAKGSG
ncbi:DNA-binding protein [Mesorhizobium sp. KR1-2]|uniref:DNA-binding protein n=1 Tax=Mesorhizobium sp. KR1-2 TaxID=3156609 RepID=UPI0032B61E37